MSLSKIASLSVLALALTALTPTARASTLSRDQVSTPAQAAASADSQTAIEASYVSDHHRPAPHRRHRPAPKPKPAPGG